jgi:hypothetical protein
MQKHRSTMEKTKPRIAPVKLQRKPELGSLRHIIVTNPSKPLFIHPLLWTTDFLAFLDCSALQLLPPGCHTEETNIRAFSKHRDVQRSIGELRNMSGHFSHDSKIRSFLIRLVDMMQPRRSEPLVKFCM